MRVWRVWLKGWRMGVASAVVRGAGHVQRSRAKVNCTGDFRASSRAQASRAQGANFINT